MNEKFQAVLTSTATSVTWGNPSGNCVLNNGTANTISATTTANTALSITCPYAQQELFTVLVNGDATTTDTFYVTFTIPECFSWFTATVSGSLRVWVADPTNLSAAESAGTATVPSAQSLQLTNAFYSIGEWPSVTLSSEVSITAAAFNSSFGYIFDSFPAYFD